MVADDDAHLWSSVIWWVKTVLRLGVGWRTERSNEGSALRGLNVHVTAVWDNSLVGEEHSVLPMTKDAGAES